LRKDVRCTGSLLRCGQRPCAAAVRCGVRVACDELNGSACMQSGPRRSVGAMDGADAAYRDVLAAVLRGPLCVQADPPPMLHERRSHRASGSHHDAEVSGRA